MKRRLGILLGAVLACAGTAGAQGGLEALADNPKVQTLGEGKLNNLKMTSDLIFAVSAAKNKSLAPEFVAQRAEKALREGGYQLLVGVSDIEAATKAAAKLGMTVVNSFDQYGCRTITVQTEDLAKVGALVDESSVKQIMFEPLAMTNVGSVDGQADEALAADLARTNYGVDGTGLRIGVMSDTFNRVGTAGTISSNVLTGNASQLSGDLPASLRVLDPGPVSGTDEGRAMAELIHDVAPGAAISFASAFSSYAAFASNITALATDSGNECDIITDDVSYFAEPIYQDGPIALAYEAAYAQGIPSFSSAGNNYRRAFEGAFVDVNPGASESTSYPTAGSDLHDFGGGDTHLGITVPANGTVTIVLHWDQPYGGTLGAGPGSEVDLDLFLTTTTTFPKNAGNTPVRSISLQGTTGAPFGEPVEVIQATAGGAAVPCHVIIDHRSGVFPTSIHLMVLGATINDTAFLNTRTIYGHTAAEHVMSVAASNWIDLETGGVVVGATANVDPETFTSLGGALPFKFDSLGNPMATVTRNKPNITAPDGTNTSFFGQAGIFGTPGVYKGEDDAFKNFFGTSAAAPHAAAAAALLMEAGPSLTVDDVYAALTDSAVDINSGAADQTGPGYDFRTGHGYIDTAAAIGISVGPTPVLSTTAPNPTSNSTIHFDADFGEVVSGFTPEDIDVSNGTVSAFTGAGGSYEFNVTASALGHVTVQIPAGGCENTAGNSNEASNVLKVRYTEMILSVTPTSTNVGSAAGTTSFNVENLGTGDMDWFVVPGQGSSWLNVTSGASGTNSGTINCSFGANPLPGSRVAQFRVKAGAAQNTLVTVTVTQAATTAVLDVTPATRNVGNGSGSTTFDVSNTGGTAMPWTATVVWGSWLTITSGDSGTDAGTITCSYGFNPTTSARTAKVRVTSTGAGGSPKDLFVTQAAGVQAELAVTPSHQDVDKAAGTTTFDVSNVGGVTKRLGDKAIDPAAVPMHWTATVIDGASWVTITSGASGTDSGTITCSFTTNPRIFTRSATIRISARGAIGNPVTVTITQDRGDPPSILEVDPTNQDVTSAAGNTSFNVANSGGGTMDYTATVVKGDDWITITSGNAGTDFGTIAVDYEENRTTSPRVGKIRIFAPSTEEGHVDVTVSQDAGNPPVLNVGPPSYSVLFTPGQQLFTVGNTGGGAMAWTASVVDGGTWLSIVAGTESGTNAGGILVDYPANLTGVPRTGKVRIIAPGALGGIKEVTVTQQPI